MSAKTVVVLAGGLGTRVASVAGEKPKALLDIGGRTFLERKLDEFVRNGLNAALLLVGHGSEEVTRWLSGNATSIPVATLSDGVALQGTGGALLSALPLLPDYFYLTYGDALLDIDYSAVEDIVKGDSARRGCLVVCKPQASVDGRCNTQIGDGLVVAHSKTDVTSAMAWLDYGLALLKRDDLVDLQLGTRPVDLSVVYSLLAERRLLQAYETMTRYLEIGTPEALDFVRHNLGAKTPSK